jgi:hypothetical protein
MQIQENLTWDHQPFSFLSSPQAICGNDMLGVLLLAGALLLGIFLTTNLVTRDSLFVGHVCKVAYLLGIRVSKVERSRFLLYPAHTQGEGPVAPLFQTEALNYWGKHVRQQDKRPSSCLVVAFAGG